MADMDSPAGWINREGAAGNVRLQYNTVKVIGAFCPTVFRFQKTLGQFREADLLTTAFVES